MQNIENPLLRSLDTTLDRKQGWADLMRRMAAEMSPHCGGHTMGSIWQAIARLEMEIERETIAQESDRMAQYVDYLTSIAKD